MWKKNFWRPEYLAVVIAIFALGISLLEPLEKLLAKPVLDMSIAPGGYIASNYGTVQLSATVSITNSGSADETFDRITCTVKQGNDEHKFQANSFSLSVPGMPVQNILLTGQQLAPGDRFLNPINCISLHENSQRTSKFTLLSNRILEEVRMAGGLDCQRQYFNPYFSFSEELQKDILEFFDSGRTFEEGSNIVVFSLENSAGDTLVSKEVSMQVSEEHQAVLTGARKMFVEGFGHPGVCPLPLGWAVEVLLSDL